MMLGVPSRATLRASKDPLHSALSTSSQIFSQSASKVQSVEVIGPVKIVGFTQLKVEVVGSMKIVGFA